MDFQLDIFVNVGLLRFFSTDRAMDNIKLKVQICNPFEWPKIEFQNALPIYLSTDVRKFVCVCVCVCGQQFLFSVAMCLFSFTFSNSNRTLNDKYHYEDINVKRQIKRV